MPINQIMFHFSIACIHGNDHLNLHSPVYCVTDGINEHWFNLANKPVYSWHCATKAKELTCIIQIYSFHCSGFASTPESLKSPTILLDCLFKILLCLATKKCNEEEFAYHDATLKHIALSGDVNDTNKLCTNHVMHRHIWICFGICLSFSHRFCLSFRNLTNNINSSLNCEQLWCFVPMNNTWMKQILFLAIHVRDQFVIPSRAVILPPYITDSPRETTWMA